MNFSRSFARSCGIHHVGYALTCAITALALIMSLSVCPTRAYAEQLAQTPEQTFSQNTMPFAVSAGTIAGPVTDGYTYFGMEYAPQDPGADTWGYIYPQKQTDLYTVTVPSGTTSLILTFDEEQVAYGYSETASYICDGSGNANGYENNGQTGKMQATFSCEQGETLPAYIWVQTPYDSNWSNTFLYAISIVYEQGNPGPGQNDPENIDPDVQTIYDDTTQLINGILNENNGASYGAEWWILAAARAEQSIPESYGKSVAAKLTETNGVLHTSAGNYTNYAKTILALTSAGIDPTNIGGFNVLNALADYTQVTKQGLTGAVYALLALDSHNYEIPIAQQGVVQTTRDALVDYIVDAQLSNGGWTLSGSDPDPDATASAIEALAPYKQSNSDASLAINRAIDVLSTIQLEDGGFSSWGTNNSNSAAQVIIALISVDINPLTDTRFIKQGNTAVDALCGFASTDGGFGYSDTTYNAMATQQGHLALTALNRMLSGKSTLYDMKELNLQKVSYTANDQATENNTQQNAENTNAGQTTTQQTPQTSDSWAVRGAAMLAILASIAVAFLTWRKFHQKQA